jgi:hypothetical protein
VHNLDAGGDYLRYGGQLQSFWRLGRGPRTLSGRLYLDAVTGSLDEVVFTQLPQLGGPYLLRGYDRDQFRDRIATLGSFEYTWDLGRYPMASMFVAMAALYKKRLAASAIGSATQIRLDACAIVSHVTMPAAPADLRSSRTASANTA